MGQTAELRLPIPGLTLAAKAWGPADGPRVLALHGWQDNAGTFDLLAPLLPGLRIVALDLTGHGLSDHRAHGLAYSFLDWVVDTHAALDTLGWDDCCILAHSLGAGIANALAASWPERITRICAIDGYAPRTDLPEAGPDALREHVRSRRVLAERGNRTFADQAAAEARLLERIRGLTPEAARVLAARGTEPTGDGRVTWRRAATIQAGPQARLTAEQIEAYLARVRCPSLLIRPRDGWPISDERIARLRELFEDRMRIEFLDGGHHVHLERPEAVADLARPFLCGSD